ncbi:1,4-alpha-glucan branching protein domain-containing protein [Bacillus pinisoli]|uniref:1,4-alpha-glucan branching protein domain-containing protein n=1 Tax=Bacillus pinisoli TaxID=2901866 RepID=UPI001FF3B20B|nr:1,4-alpha-glucan branching protein domain-containing protein [Bacillus pinisoli]
MGYMYLNLVLHAHLPYVRHKEANRLEERWLYEAITECYIPLLWNLEKGMNASYTISFSPPLMEMLADPLVQRRYIQHIDNTKSLIKNEYGHVKTEEEQKLAAYYDERFTKIRETFLKWNQNLLSGFRYYFELGQIECITSSATHTFLPYLETEQGLHMQISHGISCFEKHFGIRPKGMWLPECAFTPGLDKTLHMEGIQYTFVDEHALLHADPTPKYGVGAPVYSPHGVALFGRNQALSNYIWSSSFGYPGDPNYREFYRDIAYERDWDYIKPYVHPEGIRIDSGLKYHRITGQTEWKEFYDPRAASTAVKKHAHHFRTVLLDHFTRKGDQSFPPHIVTLPFDAELFGHWWFEGPEWIHELFAYPLSQVEAITPSEFLQRHFRDIETAHISFATWGRDGYGDVWLNHKNEWMYRHLHYMEKKLIELTATQNIETPLVKKAVQQLAREWMLATSSDWAFIVDNESASQYAANRCHEHIERFDYLVERVEQGEVTEELLTKLESEYPFMKDIDLTPLQSKHDEYVVKYKNLSSARKVLMLTWEYPPRIVGGLARHVFELSKSMAGSDCELYVLTAMEDGLPFYEYSNGIHIYRVSNFQNKTDDFIHWIDSLNLSLINQAVELAKKINFDLIHAHDWLVEGAAITLKKAFEVPLLVTIHATESGRNNGIFTKMQETIQAREISLIKEASSVIACSDYMKNEIIKLSSCSAEKIKIIPNGVDRSCFEKLKEEDGKWNEYISNDHHIVFSIGRIVPEKGFQTLIEAAPYVIEKHPNVTFIIGGKGPLEKKYNDLIQESNLQDHIHLVGFVNDQERNHLLKSCDVAVFPSLYEPFGIAALEAMIARKPVVASNTGGMASFVKNGITGLTVAPGSAEELAKAISVLLSNQTLASKMAYNGQQLAMKEYNWDSIGVRTKDIYESMILT